MDRLKETIEEKYYWRPEYRIALDWAELALSQGSDPLQVINFVTAQLFSKALPTQSQLVRITP